MLPWGKVYGVFNAKYMYLFNIVLFELGSAVCGAAPSMTAPVIGRVIAGVGGLGMYSGTLSFVTMLTWLRERPIYMVGSTAIWGVGSVLGPVVRPERVSCVVQRIKTGIRSGQIKVLGARINSRDIISLSWSWEVRRLG